MQLAIFWSEILHYHAARIAALCKSAEEQGHAIHAFALRSGDPDLLVSGYHNLLGSRITILTDDPAISGPSTEHSTRQVADFLSFCTPDIVAIPGYSEPATLSALSWCRRNHRGTILMSDSKTDDYLRSPVREWLKRGLISCFDAALVAGSPQVAYAVSLGMPANRIFTGYDAVDNDFWAGWATRIRLDSDAWRERLGVPHSFFLTASRLIPKKNVAGLLRAYARYVAQTQTAVWPLLISGDGPLREHLAHLAAELHVERLVRFVGYLSADQIAPLYALASVFILDSAYYEQWGLVVNEAMAAGTPVLVSKDCGSAADLVVDGETGFRFDPKDEDALAALLLQCTQGAFNLMQMGLAAQSRIARFHPTVFAENLLLAADAASKNARSRRFDLASLAYIAGTRHFLRVTTARVE